MQHAVVPSDASHLAALSKFLRDFWSASSLPVAEEGSFQLALEEVFMNVVMHGSQIMPAPQVGVSVSLVEGCVTLMVEDDGPPFNPLLLPAPDLSLSLDERPVGGLGVFLVRQLMDSVRYERRGTLNQLQMTKQLVVGSAPSK